MRRADNGRKTIDVRSNGLNKSSRRTLTMTKYLRPRLQLLTVYTVIDRQKGNIIASNGAFGWTGGFGFCEATQPRRVCYTCNMMPNMERYYHLRMRSVAYGCLE
jgi:hypothetical protein